MQVILFSVRAYTFAVKQVLQCNILINSVTYLLCVHTNVFILFLQSIFVSFFIVFYFLVVELSVSFSKKSHL